MSAVPSAEPSGVADHGRTGSPAMLLVFRNELPCASR